MELPENCRRLRIHVGESDLWNHRPLYEALVMQARDAGMAGATVFRSPMGFGANSRVHTAKVLNLSSDLPMVVELVDTEEKLQGFIATIRPMIAGGLMTLEPVQVLHYRSDVVPPDAG